MPTRAVPRAHCSKKAMRAAALDKVGYNQTVNGDSALHVVPAEG